MKFVMSQGFKVYTPSIEECFRRYREELRYQLDFLGAQQILAEDLVEAYFRLRGEKRIKALNFILDREDGAKIMFDVVKRIVWMGHSKDSKKRKSASLRLIEISELVNARPEVLSEELSNLMRFVTSIAESAKKRLEENE